MEIFKEYWLFGVLILSILGIGVELTPNIKIKPIKVLSYPFRYFLGILDLEKRIAKGEALDEQYMEDSKKLIALEQQHINDMTKVDELINLFHLSNIDRLFDNIRIIKQSLVKKEMQVLTIGKLTLEQYKETFKQEKDYEAVKSKLKKYIGGLVDEEDIPNGEIKPMLKIIHDAYENKQIITKEELVIAKSKKK